MKSRLKGPRARVTSLTLFVMVAAAATLAAFAATAHAATQPQLPFRCFAQVDVTHVVFGPDSFFLPNTVQGPTSFSENAGPTIVTYPLYHGESNGEKVYYVITDASNRSAAQASAVASMSARLSPGKPRMTWAHKSMPRPFERATASTNASK